MAKNSDKRIPGDNPPQQGAGDGSEGLAGLTSGDYKPHHASFGTRLRNYFLTGLIIVGPVGITLYIVWWFITLIDGWVKPLIPEQYLPDSILPFSVPGLGLIIAVTALILIGAFTANLFGRTLVNYGERLVNQMPIVRSVYRAIKQIFETILSQSSASFQNVGLIEYPRKGLYAVVFISTATKGEIRTKAGDHDELFSVFLPTTPNPTSGFLLFVPRSDVTVLDMSVEDGAKLVISAGLVVPNYQDKLTQLAKDAKTPRPVPQKEAV